MMGVATDYPKLQARLYQLGLRSRDVPGLADFYSRALGYRFQPAEGGLLGTARDRRLMIFPGPARTLAHAAYAVEDPVELERLSLRLEKGGVRTRRGDIPGLRPGALQLEDPDGNLFLFGIPAAVDPAPTKATAARAARLQHLVFASSQIGTMLSFFIEQIGFAVSDRVVDETGDLRTAFLRCSEEHHSLAIFAAGEKRLDHHCYEAGDWALIRDWSDHFAGEHIPLKWGPGRHGPGANLFVFIHDPDGNWVEISAELEHLRPDHQARDWPHEERTLNSWGAGILRS